MSTGDCICEGNWRLIVADSEHLIGRLFRDQRTSEVWRYFGPVHGGDDYYYGMGKVGAPGYVLLSCVGNFESWGMELVE